METDVVRSLVITDADARSKTRAAKTTPKKKPTSRKGAVKKAPKKTTTRTKKTLRTSKKIAAQKTSTPAKASGKAAAKEPRITRREPLGHLLIEKKLREAGFHGGISSDKELLERYSYDESIFSVQPQLVLQPKDTKDVETAVRVIGTETQTFQSLSLTPRAAGTGLSGGSLTDSIVIDVVAHMHRITHVGKKKGVVTFTCEPGAMWRDVEKRLKKLDAYLPPYPASKDICTIGGSVGNNAAGPDSLRFGHVAHWVESLDVTLYDGNTYTLKPITYKEFKVLIKKKHAHARIAEAVYTLIKDNEKAIHAARPKTKKNSAGYALWDIINGSVSEFEKGKATFDLTQLVSGSQGTIGIITAVTMRAEPIHHKTALIAVPIFNLQEAGAAIVASLKFDPINVEIFDALTFDLALKNPDFFKTRLSGTLYYRVLLSMYTTYHVRYRRKIPEFTLLITLPENRANEASAGKIVRTLREKTKVRARLVKSPVEKEMFWQVRRASYTLSKFQDTKKRPAAFLEDMTVPPENLSKFFLDIKKLLTKYNVTAAVHGHGGNGHLHFYPLLDFTNKTTPALVEKMAEEFFETAVKHGGNICGEHNDGIIRTPHLNKIFNAETLNLFKHLEHLFDPLDIFNPGKKTNPRFDVKETIRKIN